MIDDLKTVGLMTLAVILAGVVLYFGDDLDIPILKQAHDGLGG